MGKRKGRSSSEASETLNHMKVEHDEEDQVEGKGGFFACYLLTSLCPRFKGHTYIGFTVNPKRRIRQHNGEIRCGAWRTKNKRPWEMVLCIYGFPTNVAALQFEWAWQHPVESLAVRKAAVAFKSLGGLANKIKLAYTMLTLPAWQSLDLTVNFFSTKYTTHSAGCPSLPDQMKVQVCSMDELPCYGGEDWNAYENSELKSDDNDDIFIDHRTSIEETTRVEERVEGKGVLGVIEDCTSESDIDMRTRNQLLNITDGDESQSTIKSCTILQSTIKSSSESDIDMRTRNQLLNRTDGDESQSTIKSCTIRPCEIEVIDVFTPSPKNRINSKRKKIGVFPEIIDLTKSPIFV